MTISQTNMLCLYIYIRYMLIYQDDKDQLTSETENKNLWLTGLELAENITFQTIKQPSRYEQSKENT